MIILLIISLCIMALIIVATEKRSTRKTNQTYSEENREYRTAKATQTLPKYHRPATSRTPSYSPSYSLSQQDAVYAQSVEKRDPLMLPTYKGAISKMSEKDRVAYYKAVDDIKERIASGTVVINAWYQVIKYEHYAKMILRKALKQGDEKTARYAANNLFYTIVCRAAVYTKDSVLPDSNLWLRQYGVACLNLTYFRLGKIVGKRSAGSFEDSLQEEYTLIEAALGTECEKPTTNWSSIQQLAQTISEKT